MSSLWLEVDSRVIYRGRLRAQSWGEAVVLKIILGTDSGLMGFGQGFDSDG